MTPRRTPSLFTMVLLLAPPIAAQQGLTLRDVALTRSVGTTAISPDGRAIAYTVQVPRTPLEGDDGPSHTELHLLGPDGSSRPYVSGQVRVSQITFRPGGEEIAYLAKRDDDEHSALWSIPVAGGESRRLIAHAEDIAAYSFSPDGARVAFLATDAKPEGAKELEDKGFDQEIYEEDRRFERVWLATLGDDAEPVALALEGNASELHWSPDGGHLAVALAPTPLVDDEYMRRRLHIVEIETGQISGTVETVGKLGEVAWSPDGAHLALIAAADLHDPRQGRLVVTSAAGGPTRELLPDFPGHVVDLAWKDASTLLYLGDLGVECEIGSVSPDGSSRAVLLAAGDRAWGDLAVAGDVVAVTGEGPDHPAELFRWGAGEPKPVRVTDSNPWLAQRRLATQETVRYAARDGLEIEGLLIRPRGVEPGQRSPLVVVVHGGPESHWRNGWITRYANPGQVLADQGFAVFYPNYRASTGRGVAFSKLDQGDGAGKEFDDIVDGIDHLAALGLIDPERVGITGGSYGGFATAWGATYYSHRYAAAVMFVGISNQLSKSGTTDIFHEMSLVHWLKKPWEDWQLFIERSPIYHAPKNRTPTLILHGKEDPRVHPSQSLEMYRYLKNAGQAPVRLVLYPGEKHGNRRAASQLDLSIRLLRWMTHYLKGPGGEPPAYEVDYTAAMSTAE